MERCDKDLFSIGITLMSIEELHLFEDSSQCMFLFTAVYGDVILFFFKTGDRGGKIYQNFEASQAQYQVATLRRSEAWCFLV